MTSPNLPKMFIYIYIYSIQIKIISYYNGYNGYDINDMWFIIYLFSKVNKVSNKSRGILCFHCPRCRAADRRNGHVWRQCHGHLRNDARGGAATELSASAQGDAKHLILILCTFFVGSRWWNDLIICAGESNFIVVLSGRKDVTHRGGCFSVLFSCFDLSLTTCEVQKTTSTHRKVVMELAEDWTSTTNLRTFSLQELNIDPWKSLFYLRKHIGN